MKLKRYELSSEADNDLEDIFNYTNYKFGLQQAIKYLTDIDAVLHKLVLQPNLGRERSEIKKDLFSIVEQEHVIFYRIKKSHIRIVRVLHGSKDLIRYF